MLYHLTLCRNFRDRSLCAWSASSGEFLFARRYCHGGEVTAVDVTAHGSVIVTGSRDTSVLVWGIQVDHDALMPVPMRRHAVEDRVWSVAVSSGTQQVFFFSKISSFKITNLIHPQMIAVGTAATRGVAPLRLFDLLSGAHLMDLGSDLKRGAGMLDISWLTPSTLLSCGYDTFTRLWDTRCRSAVRSWEEEYDESVYCLATDKVRFFSVYN